MNGYLTTFWVEFGDAHANKYGVTAYSLDDAISLLKEKVFRKQPMPPILNYKENIRVSDLDQNHVVPNIGPISERGIWFPISYFP